jgi:hypothetical protein
MEVSMAKSVDDASDNITADVAALREDMARLTESVGSLLKSGTHGAGQRVSEAVDDAKAKFTSKAADVK